MIAAVGPQHAQTQFRGHTIWTADAHCDGKRFIVRADEKLTAFVELAPAKQFREDKKSTGQFTIPDERGFA